MFRMYAYNSHICTHLTLALGIVREPTIWIFITSKYPSTHDIGLATRRGRAVDEPSTARARSCFNCTKLGLQYTSASSVRLLINGIVCCDARGVSLYNENKRA